MGDALNDLLEKALAIKMTPHQIREQRVSFVYGNTNIENGRITKQMVQELDAKLTAAEKK
jgi:hypothetical protein